MAAPPDFTTGQVLTAAQMNAVGLWLVKTQTIGSAVSSVTVSSAFSTDYDVYLITVSGGAGSGSNAWTLQLGSTNTGYYNSGYVVPYTGAASLSQRNNGVSWANVGIQSTNSGNAYIILNGPNLAKRTYITANYIFGDPAGGGDAMTINGYQNSDTQFTALTLGFGGGTMTGGTIRVYGYRK